MQLALAHDRACEAELADLLAIDLDQDRVPDIAVLSALFGPDDTALPEIAVVVVTPLARTIVPRQQLFNFAHQRRVRTTAGRLRETDRTGYALCVLI